jgi:hypothetical protein
MQPPPSGPSYNAPLLGPLVDLGEEAAEDLALEASLCLVDLLDRLVDLAVRLGLVGVKLGLDVELGVDSLDLGLGLGRADAVVGVERLPLGRRREREREVDRPRALVVLQSAARVRARLSAEAGRFDRDRFDLMQPPHDAPGCRCRSCQAPPAEQRRRGRRPGPGSTRPSG